MVTQDKADKIARKVLGLGGTDPIEPAVSELMQAHLTIYPDDHNFLLNPHDPSPYGSITCIEDNCNCDFNLTKGPDGDGGNFIGLGSLSAFWDHIETSQAHRTARDKRVARALAKMKDIKPDIRPHVQPAKRSSLDGQEGSNKKPKLVGEHGGVGVPTSVLGERLNNTIARPPVPALVPAAHTVPFQYPGRLPQPAEYAQAHAQLKKELAINESTLVGLKAERNKDVDYWKRYDELVKAINDAKAQQRRLLDLYGPVPGGAPASVQQNAVAGGSGARSALAAAAARVAGVGGAMMDALAAVGVGGLGGAGYEEIPGFTGTTSEDFEEFIRRAAEGDDFEGNLTVDAAAEHLGLAHQRECVDSMVVPLMPHQLIGVAWMLDKENSSHYGGILGDEMGLGKTVQTIAIMARSPSCDPNEKTTLIVAPLALLTQWKEEILSKMVENHWRILIHHGSERVKDKKDLMKYDVVLTTYQTLANEWPDEETAVKKVKSSKKKQGIAVDSDEDDFVKLKKPGPLFEVGFYRVVLDEAQNIRNRNTKISRAVSRLDSLFRWCLTGTPITNSLSDVFPLLRFLQIKPLFYIWQDFQSHVVQHEKRNPALAGKRTQIILSTVLLRRKKDSMLDGKPLITLPPKVVELQVLEFSAEEREIYTFVETRSQATFNKFLKQGTVLKNYASVLVMLLRLRQLCLHPCLISEGYDELAKDAEADQMAADELVRAEKTLGQTIVDKIRKARLQIVVARIRAEKLKEELEEDDDCPICLDQVGSGEGGGVVTKCGHTFCRECVSDVLVQPAPDEDVSDPGAVKYRDDERPCPSCRQPISKRLLFDLVAFDPTSKEIVAATGDMDISLDDFIVQDDEGEEGKADSDDDDESAPVVVKGKGKSRAIILDSDDEGEKEEKANAEKAEKNAIRKKETRQRELPEWMVRQEPSTKMKWLLLEIQRIGEEHPDDKFLVVSQFTTALDIVDDYLNSNGIRVTRFQGDMSSSQRDESVRILAKSKKCKVMLMSLKAGGVGLNLVRANRVVNLDLGWSHAVEAQAFDRVHRIGQLKDVRVDRLTIANTVEQRIADLQDRKKGLADASLGEGGGAKLGKLSVHDLANLFGVKMR